MTVVLAFWLPRIWAHIFLWSIRIHRWSVISVIIRPPLGHVCIIMFILILRGNIVFYVRRLFLLWKCWRGTQCYTSKGNALSVRFVILYLQLPPLWLCIFMVSMVPVMSAISVIPGLILQLKENDIIENVLTKVALGLLMITIQLHWMSRFVFYFIVVEYF